MALTPDKIKSDYPLPSYNYKVDIGKDTIAFSEVSGLNIAYEKTVYKESSTESGKASPRVFRMPAQATDTTLTLKKGLVPAKSAPALYDWINSISLNQVQKKTSSSVCATRPESRWSAGPSSTHFRRSWMRRRSVRRRTTRPSKAWNCWPMAPRSTTNRNASE